MKTISVISFVFILSFLTLNENGIDFHSQSVNPSWSNSLQTSELTGQFSNLPGLEDAFSNTFVDARDGQTYKIVEIGKQIWMAQNLNFNAKGSWCYKNSNKNCPMYGRLYQYEIALSVCPAGWHLPSRAEFETLLMQYGDSVAFQALAKEGFSGFNMELGGYRNQNGLFQALGNYGFYWSASPNSYGDAWRLYIRKDNQEICVNPYYRACSFSVRCVQNN